MDDLFIAVTCTCLGLTNFSLKNFSHDNVNYVYALTRPDTRPIPVADGWAGAETLVFPLFDSCSPTDGRTDGRTDKASYKVACPQLKKNEKV